MSILSQVQESISLEIRSLELSRELLESQEPQLNAIFSLLNSVRPSGKIVLTGVGKCWFVASKLTATLNSLGQEAVTLDPTNAFHGDFGVCNAGDVLLCFSHSGRTSELLNVVRYSALLELTSICITSSPDSPLAKLCSYYLFYQIDRESCHLGLAPTASTTTMLALGDALATVLAKLNGFTSENFFRFHPKGSLVQNSSVESLITAKSELPTLSPLATFREVLQGMTDYKVGICFIEQDSQFLGILTDGDIRRNFLCNVSIDDPIKRFYNRNPVSVSSNQSILDCVLLLQKHSVSYIVVTDNQGRLAGCIDERRLR